MLRKPQAPAHSRSSFHTEGEATVDRAGANKSFVAPDRIDSQSPTVSLRGFESWGRGGRRKLFCTKLYRERPNPPKNGEHHQYAFGSSSVPWYAFAAAKMYVIACDARAVLPAPCGARARPDRMVEDVDQHRLGGHSKRQGRRAVLRRSCIEPRSSHVGVGGTKGGPQHAAAVLRRCCGGSASGERGGCSGCTATPAGCSECRA